MADEAKTLEQTLAFIGSRIGEIEKTGKESQGQPYKFIEHHEVVRQAQPYLHKGGIVVVPVVTRQTVMPAPRGEGWLHAQVELEVHFRRGPDDVVKASVCGEGLDKGDKASSKAITQGLKRAYMTVLGIAVKEDNGRPRGY